MRRYLLTIIAVALALLVARAATAAEVSVAVLGIEPIDVPESLAQQLTDALRLRATSTAGVHMVQGKDLIVVIAMAGKQSVSRNVELKTGGAHDLAVTLEPEAPPPVVQKEPPPPVMTPPLVTPTPLANKPVAHPGRAATIAGIAALGGALV